MPQELYPPFEFIDAPGIRIEYPDLPGKPVSQIYIKLHTEERVLQIRNAHGCNTLAGCHFFGSQYYKASPIQIISPLGNTFTMGQPTDLPPRNGKRFIQYDIYDA